MRHPFLSVQMICHRQSPEQDTGSLCHSSTSRSRFRRDCRNVKKERNISAALTLARECKIALFGVGNLSRNTILYRSGSLKEEDFIELEEKGAVGDVCTCFFDARGEAVSSSFAKRRISITLEELKKIPCKIGVASGLEKKKHFMLHYWANT